MRRLVVISGAGISAESGIRTFRTDEASGKALWDEYDIKEVCDIHAFKCGFKYHGSDDVAPPSALSQNPATLGQNLYSLTHDFYNKRREELVTVEPNVAHARIAEWYKNYPGQVVNITTNVDDLLERAGVPQHDVLHVHGYLKEIVTEDAFTGERIVTNIGYNTINPNDYDWVKPNVVFFHEHAPAYQELNNLMSSLTAKDLVIVVGCSNVVINFVGELVQYQKWGGYRIVVVNPKPEDYERMKHGEGDLTLFNRTAVDAFSYPLFIKMVEDHLEAKTALQKL